MTTVEEEEDFPAFTVVKNGRLLELPIDLHTDVSRYLAIKAPGMLVLLEENDQKSSVVDDENSKSPESHEIADRDAHLIRAFAALGARVRASVWTSSNQPYSEMVAAFKALDAQELVRADISDYLAKNPSVGSAVDMLFTSIAMSARANWRAAPIGMQGIAARGWFLGRWAPTFLVLDGPISRFLTSEAFRRQTGDSMFFRAVKSFFSNRDFMLLRHGFAHWSFSWRTDGIDSEVVTHDQNPNKVVRVSRAEADAFHIITFAVVEAVYDVFIESRRKS